jgi:hypothetical protein
MTSQSGPNVPIHRNVAFAWQLVARIRIVSPWCSTLELRIQPVVGQVAENAEEIDARALRLTGDCTISHTTFAGVPPASSSRPPPHRMLAYYQPDRLSFQVREWYHFPEHTEFSGVCSTFKLLGRQA